MQAKQLVVADSLQKADWSEGEEGKPRLAVLNFTLGTGVSQAEVETVTYDTGVFENCLYK